MAGLLPKIQGEVGLKGSLTFCLTVKSVLSLTQLSFFGVIGFDRSSHYLHEKSRVHF